MTTYASNNVSLPNLFDEVGIAARSVENLVPILDPAFQRPVHARLIDQLSGGTLNSKKSGQRLFTTFRSENDFPFVTIQNRQVNGAYLNLVFDQSQFTALVEGNMVKSDSGALGKVLSKEAGKMTIGFVANPNGNTSFVAADFAANSGVSDRGAIGNTVNRQEVEYVMPLPDSIQNIVPTYNQSCEILHDDVYSETHLLNREGKPFYAMIKEFKALGLLNRQYVARTLDNVPAVLTGNEPVAASLLNQILTQGGGQTTFGQNDVMTESILQDTLERFVSTGSFTTGEVLGIFGQRLYGSIQNALKGYLVTAGKDNTIGGETVKGIDIKEYAFGGVSLKMMLEPIYSDTRMWGVNSNNFSRRANTGMLMSTERVTTQQGVNVPFMSSRYFSSSEDILRSVTPGMIDEKGNHQKTSANGKKSAMVNYTLDKVDYFNNAKATWYIGE